MMWVILIVIFAVALASVAVAVVVTNFKKAERKKYYTSAGNIIREDFLNYSLQNRMLNSGETSMPSGKKMMLYMKTTSRSGKNRFVFDPEKGVRIGRDKFNSNIFISDNTVSQNHCYIYSDKEKVYLKDCNSANGTAVRRGLMKSYSITDGCKIELHTGDVVCVGSIRFKIVLFYYDMSRM